MTLRVKLEIVPFGDEERIYEIGRLDIYNKGPVGFGHSEYGVIEMSPKTNGLHNKTVYHRSAHGAWALLAKTLAQLPIEGP